VPIKKTGSKAARGKRSLKADSSLRFEKLLKEVSSIQHYSFRLFITGTTARSAEAVANIRALCEEHLKGRYDLAVIDIYQHPTQAMKEQIIAAPTLVKTMPRPIKRFIGNLSDHDKVVVGLNLHMKKTGSDTKWRKV